MRIGKGMQGKGERGVKKTAKVRTRAAQLFKLEWREVMSDESWDDRRS